ncbi:hypothetical protein [Streptomyces sp. H51]|uniref:hypothetical protein n=1 Tax=Streptomyces sp. H51 TaxID=3111770 RepID=UPI002D79C69B|nr:hypothetical protein [Streptomyces sp. H51]
MSIALADAQLGGQRKGGEGDQGQQGRRGGHGRAGQAGEAVSRPWPSSQPRPNSAYGT